MAVSVDGVVNLPSVPFMTKHNEQHLKVLSFSNAPQAKNLGSIDQQLAALCLLSSANRETDLYNHTGMNAQATQGKRGSFHFRVSTRPLFLRNQLTFSSVLCFFAWSVSCLRSLLCEVSSI